MSAVTPSDSLTPSAQSPIICSRGRHLPVVLRELLSCFQSLHLAIILLSLLAIGILIGVFMPQEGLVELQEIKRTYGQNYALFKAMGFFNVYSAYWFVSIQVLFFFNLLSGSFRWLKPAFMSATQKTFCTAQSIGRAKRHFQITTRQGETVVLRAVLDRLRQTHYRVYCQRDPNKPEEWQVYASKGNFSRFGPVIAHFGILLFLVASVYGNFTGFKAQKLVVPGQTFTIRQSEKWTPNIEKSIWLGTVPDWRIKVKNFRIDFYRDHPETPQQYYTDLAVRDSGRALLKAQTISVNHPLTIGDVTIYQASFAPTGRLFMEINGVPRTLTVNSNFGNRSVSITPLNPDKKQLALKQLALVVFPFYVQQDPGVTKNRVRLMLLSERGFVGAGPGRMPKNLKLEEGQSGELEGLHVKFLKPEIATGLQIKSSPEVLWVYLGYLIIAAGTMMCIFSQRQIWVALNQRSGESDIYFLYKTNKARISFMKELGNIQQDLRLLLCRETGALKVHDNKER